MNQDEKVMELSQRLLDGVNQTFKSNRFKQYLNAVSVFHRYSSRNTALIFLQSPSATHVAGFEAWKKLGRYVRRGETGISIFAPSKLVVKLNQPLLDDNGNPVFDQDGNPKTETIQKSKIHFRAVTVFDISQTDGDPLPALCNELQGAVPDLQNIFTAVQKISPYKIVFEDMHGEMKGFCQHSKHLIAIKFGMSDEQIVKTLLHEFAHAVLHARSEKSKEQKEIEAESVAFIVSDFLGIDTSGYSFDYVSSWSYGMEAAQLQDMMENIQDNANTLIGKIQTELESLEKSPEHKIENLPIRLSKALEKSEQLNSEKEMIPNANLLAQ
ncbi:hypothetical protein A7X67_11170 [Clostridium sp. W14A]|nr:hypothetical protein A7X67_11170 [Clostridium sp. W14A]